MRTTLEIPDPPQHFVMSGVSWQYYESTLEQVRERPIQWHFLMGCLNSCRRFQNTIRKRRPSVT